MSVTWRVSYHRAGGGAQPGASTASRCCLLAVLRVLADADLALLQELVREQALVVRLRDPDDRKRQRRLLLACRSAWSRSTSGFWPLSSATAACGRGGRLVAARTCRRCPSASRRGCTGRPAASRPGRSAGSASGAGLQVGDHGTGDVVVRRDGTVDLVVRLDQHLAEDRSPRSSRASRARTAAGPS